MDNLWLEAGLVLAICQSGTQGWLDVIVIVAAIFAGIAGEYWRD